MADEKPRRKLILHFDARNTLFLSDKSYRFTIEEALNNYISGIVWGKQIAL
ncbi:RWD domain-containing protein, putative [Schistosoma mansoni]|uniref:RWD domain-containing protein, putative n=1 Tax=Schistosoma mansoni TaxID=6183 RepID=UPI00022C8179|nr:RWD domain-containing protein, putative [Schistosoma mansoni]|eukprot:XP_018647381.1 RWD domain-containing protein, putative [Schistosoma mansoni]